jgi:hypothetical protein
LFNLIAFLKPKMLSWAASFRYVECGGCFKKIDYLVLLIVKDWLFKKNRKKGNMFINTDGPVVPQSYIFYGKAFISKSILYFLSKRYNGVIIENWNPRLSWINSLYYISGEWARVLGNWKNYWSVLTKKYGGFNGWQQKILQIVVKDQIKKALF